MNEIGVWLLAKPVSNFLVINESNIYHSLSFNLVLIDQYNNVIYLFLGYISSDSVSNVIFPINSECLCITNKISKYVIKLATRTLAIEKAFNELIIFKKKLFSQFNSIYTYKTFDLDDTNLMQTQLLKKGVWIAYTQICTLYNVHWLSHVSYPLIKSMNVLFCFFCLS